MAKPLSRRAFLRTVGVGVAGAALTACGATATPTSAPKPTAAPAAPSAPTMVPAVPKEPATISFLARGDDAIFAVFRKMKADFETLGTGVTVTLDETPGDWHQKFQLQIASGTAPDAVFHSVDVIGTSARKNMVLPLDDLLSSEKEYNRDDFFWTAFTCANYKGKLYGLPYDGGPYVIYWDKDLFKAAGLEPLSPTKRVTWDQVLEMSKKLTLDMDGKHPGEAGFDPKRIKQYAISPHTGRWYIYVYCNGGEVLDANGNLMLDTPEAVEALQWLADLGAKHYVAPSPSFTQSNPVNFFSSNMAMQIQGAFDIVRERQRKNDWDIAPLAQGKMAVPSVLYSPLAIVTGTKKVEAAWKWIWYCCGERGQTIVADLGQTVPAIKKVAQKMALDTTTKPEHKSVFLGEFDNVRIPGDKMGSMYGSYWTEWFQIWNPIFDPVWMGTKTAAAAVKEVIPKLDKLLKTGEVT
jgi:multiple sugar transport system substrate-binding protein